MSHAQTTRITTSTEVERWDGDKWVPAERTERIETHETTEGRPHVVSDHDHSTADACGRLCPAYGDMLTEKTAARFDVPQTQNERGEWVPAIPEPLFGGLRLRKARCDCGETFRNRLRYREHFALAHILGLS